MSIRLNNVSALAVAIGCLVFLLCLALPSHGAWLGQNCGTDPASILEGDGDPSTTPPNVWRYTSCSSWFLQQHCKSGGMSPPRGWFGRLPGCPVGQASCYTSTCCPSTATACYLFYYDDNGGLTGWGLGCKPAGSDDCE